MEYHQDLSNTFSPADSIQPASQKLKVVDSTEGFDTTTEDSVTYLRQKLDFKNDVLGSHEKHNSLLRQQIESLEKEKRNLTTEIHKANAESEKYKVKFLSLEAKRESELRQQFALQDQNQKLEMNLKSEMEKKECFLMKFQEIKDDKVKVDDEKKKLEAVLDMRKKINSKCREELDELTKIVKCTQLRFDELKKSYDLKDQQYKEACKSSQILFDRLKAISANLTDIKDRVLKFGEECELMKESRTETQNRLENLSEWYRHNHGFLQKEYSALTKEVEKLQNGNEKHITNIQQLQEQLEMQTEENKLKTEMLNDLRAQLERSEHSKVAVEEKHEGGRLRISELEISQAKLQERLDASNSLLEIEKSNSEALKSNLNTIIIECNDLKAKNEQLSMHLSNIESLNREHRETEERINLENSELKSDNILKNTKISEMEHRLSNSIRIIDELQSELQQTRSAIESVTIENNENIEKAKDYENKYLHVKEGYDNSCYLIKTNETGIKEMVKQIDDLKDQLWDSRNKCITTETKLANSEEAVARYEHEKSKLMSEKDEILNQLKDSQSAIKSTHETIRNLEKTIMGQRSRESTLLSQIEGYKHQVDELFKLKEQLTKQIVELREQMTQKMQDVECFYQSQCKHSEDKISELQKRKEQLERVVNKLEFSLNQKQMIAVNKTKEYNFLVKELEKVRNDKGRCDKKIGKSAFETLG